MRENPWARHIETVRQHLDALRQHSSEWPELQLALIAEPLEDLSATVEELQVANEELRQQDEALVTARQALEAERQRYQELFELAPDGYLVTDAEGIMQEANRAAATLLRVSQRFLAGKPLILFVVREERRTFHSRLQELQRGSVHWVQNWQCRMQPRQGEPFYASVTVAAVHDRDGRVSGLRWLLRDISEQVALQQALAARARELEALYRVTKTASQELDPEQVLAQTLPKILTTVGGCGAEVHLADAEGCLTWAAAYGLQAGFVEASWPLRLRPNEGIPGRAFATQEPVLVANVEEEPQFLRREVARTFGYRTLLCIPLLAHGGPIGTLQLYGTEGHRFTAEMISLLCTIAQQLAMAIANARLHQALKASEQELLAHRDLLRSLTAGILTAREEEAKRIAHALHDEAGQLLASVHIALDEIARKLPRSARQGLHDLKGLLDQIEAHLRHLSHELRPTILDDLGLLPALQSLAARVAVRTGLAISVEGPTLGRLPPPCETALYRIVQEALTNVTKHARAARVQVQLQQEAGLICCIIQDNGIGFDVPAVLAEKGERGLGLLGIQERLDALSGTLQITSAPGRGTALRITIPLESN